jgi:hypothetical protein
MTLVAVSFGLESFSPRNMTCRTRGLLGFRGLVHSRAKIQWGFRLGKDLVVADLAVVLFTLKVLGMVEGDLSHFGFKNDLIWSLGRGLHALCDQIDRETKGYHHGKNNDNLCSFLHGWISSSKGYRNDLDFATDVVSRLGPKANDDE